MFFGGFLSKETTLKVTRIEIKICEKSNWKLMGAMKNDGNYNSNQEIQLNIR
jgi:hypothetical protein